jgi:HNH endonuclease
MKRNCPPQDFVREWLHYDPQSGIFRWRKEPRPARPLKGFIAGSQGRFGYWIIHIRDAGFISAHRLAWIYLHGDIPDGMEVDHIDGNPSFNAEANLRLATSSQQKQNKRVQSNNRSGLKGAFYHAAHKGKKWRSQIRVAGKCIFLGYYHTAEEAHAAYREAAPKYFGEFARAA